MPVEERFWSKVGVRGPDECWLWRGAKTSAGYGLIGAGRRSDGSILAHRLAWELENGLVPEGLCVCHHCDNRLCVNPKHLFTGTIGDNLEDARSKGRMSPPPHYRGEKNGNSKLTQEEVAEIRLLLADGMLQRVISEQFNVSAGTVSDINRRKTWSTT